IDQADGLCLLPVDVTAGIGQLSHETVANDAWQALQSADISGHSHVDFLDGKLCVERAVAHVTSRDQIDSASEAIALDGGNHRLAAIVHGIQGSLQLEDLTAQQLGIATDVATQATRCLGQKLQIDAGRKMLPLAGQHHHSHCVGVIDPPKYVDDLVPERSVHGIDLFRSVDRYM